MIAFPLIFREALHSLAANRMRSALAMLGIVIGVASVLAMIAVGQGGQQAVKRAIESLGSNILVVAPKETLIPGQRVARKHEFGIRDAEVLAAMPVLAAVAPSTRPQFMSVVAGSSSMMQFIIATDPGFFAVREWKAQAGEVFTAQGLARNPRVVVLGSSAARLLFPGEYAVGRVIKIASVPFTVVGVLASKGRGVDGMDQDGVVILPYEIAQARVFGQKEEGKIATIMVRVQPGIALAQAASQMRAMLRAARKIEAGQEDNFEIRDLSDISRNALKTGQVMTLLLGSIASISLLVGGIGIMNMMYMSVTERTREIGIRKSIGASQGDILMQFLLEALLLSSAGCICGLVVGVIGVLFAAMWFDIPVALGGGTVLLSSGVAMAVGLFFGYHPARKAANLLPVEALRYQ